ncbi:MAG: hypothetical protein FWE86_04435, partial [Oscillospiraceae bacterium]|nr:hypothetical protein [Oscillospiraceae bacterium]
MIGLLLLVLALAGGSLLAAAWPGRLPGRLRKIEETLPVTATAVVALLFVFYCLDLLSFGFAAVCVLCASCYAAAGYFLLINRHNRQYLLSFCRKIFSPGLLVFIFGVGMLLFLSQNVGVFRFDELRLWGAYPKILFYTSRLQTAGNSMLAYPTMNQYLPGMPLFQYFVLRFGGGFSESRILFAYGLLCLILLMPMTRRINWTRSCVIISVCTVFALLFQAATNGGGGKLYFTLFIDGAVGFFAGYLFYLAFRRPFASRFAALRFCLGLAVMPMIKESGVMFSIMAAATAVAAEILCYGGWRPARRNRTLRFSAAALTCLIFPVAVWRIMSRVYGLHRLQTFSEPFSLKYAGEFLRTVIISPMLMSSPVLSLFSVGSAYLVLAGIFCGIYFIIPKQNREKRDGRLFLLVSIGLAAANMVFIIGLYVLSAMNWDGDFMSFGRYMSSPLIADLVFA